MTYEENQNPTANLSGSKNDSNTKSISAKDLSIIGKINIVTAEDFKKSANTLKEGSDDYFRLQLGEHGGSNVFFNPKGSDTRYGLTDGINGTIYVAKSPLTAMKEVFQNKSLLESDLEKYYIANLIIDKDFQIVEATKLVKMTTLTLNDITSSSRHVTQSLAKKVHSAGYGGISFPSNVTTEECIVLWHDDPKGNGALSTQKQTCLSKYSYQGSEAADILVEQLGIPVEE